MNGIAMFIRQNLDLDMAWVTEEFLHVYRVIVEGCRRFRLGERDRIEQIGFTMDNAHAATATAASRLDNNGITDLPGNSQVFLFLFT